LNCNFSNYLSTEGAAIYLSYPGNISIKGCLFENNFAGQGASIYLVQESSYSFIEN